MRSNFYFRLSRTFSVTIDYEAMKFGLFLAFFVTFVTTSESIWCVRCHSGNFTHDLYSHFPKTDCWVSGNNSTVAHCKTACLKLQIEDNGQELNIYDCHEIIVDKKSNAKVAIKNKTVCYENFCNGESSHTKITKNSNSKSPVSEFWIYIGVIVLLSLIIHIFKLICRLKAVENSTRNEAIVNSRTRLISCRV